MCLTIEPYQQIHKIKIESEALFENGQKEIYVHGMTDFKILGKTWQVKAILQPWHMSYQRRTLLNSKISIGRDYHCDIVYGYSTVSKLHCEIFYEQGWFVKNLSEVNGTYVNGQKITQMRLEMGDCIVVAGLEIWFCQAFLLIAEPLQTTLPFFHPKYLQKERKSNEVHLFLPIKSSAPSLQLPQKKGNFLFRMQEMMMYLILLYTVGKNQNYHPQSNNMLFLVYLRLMMIFMEYSIFAIRWLRRKWCYKRDLKHYESFLKEYYPSCEVLANQYTAMRGLLKRDGDILVRIGENAQKQVVLHNFTSHPHLVCIGEKSNRETFIAQIVYQLLIYYPNIAVRLEVFSSLYWFCSSLQNVGEEVLTIGQKNLSLARYHIECLSSYHEAYNGYDALIDLKQSLYYTHEAKTEISVQSTFDRELFSRHYQYQEKSRQEEQKYDDYITLLGLKDATLFWLRQKFDIEKGLLGCIGIANQTPLYLDLNEHQDGPHLLVAGMTGSGKSEWLISYLMSLAVYYDSDDVQFFLIDFKGGGLSQVFEKLHHTIMTLTDLDLSQMTRAIAALQDEISQREQYFLSLASQFEYANMDIHVVKKLYRQKKIKKNLAHLIIVVDEFAELKLLYPKMMQALIRIARIGRSLGIHLILATQRPGGIVDSQILSNLRAKVCLKVASKQESYDVLGKTEAAFLRRAGEFYLQTQLEGSLVYGRSLLINPMQRMINLFDYQGKKLHQVVLTKEKKTSVLTSLINEINACSSKTQPFYYRDFVNCSIVQKIPNQIGYCDDYLHRQMLPLMLDLSLGMLVLVDRKENYEVLMTHLKQVPVICDPEELKALQDHTVIVLKSFSQYLKMDFQLLEHLLKHYQCLFIEDYHSKLSTRFLNDVAVQIYFNQQALLHYGLSRTELRCEPERNIGVYINQGKAYRCQILPSDA